MIHVPAVRHLDGALPIQPFAQRAMTHLKSASAIVTIATSVIASGALAYYAPGKCILALITVIPTNLFLLPRLLANGQHKWARVALIVTLVASGGLFVGASASFAYTMGSVFLASMKAMSVKGALWSAFTSTALMGYVVPTGIPLLKRAYTLMTDASWADKLIQLGEHLHHLPRAPGDFFTRTWDKFCLIAAFTLPEEAMNYRRDFNLNIPFRLLTVLNILCTQSPIDALRTTIEIMKSVAPLGHGVLAPEEYRRPLFQYLKSTLDRLEGPALKSAIELLQDNIHEIIPQMISLDQFKNLFQGRILEELTEQANAFIQESALTDRLDEQCQKMEAALIQLEEDAKDFLPEQKEGLSRRVEEINTEFLQSRQRLEKLYLSKKQWTNFTMLPRNYLASLSPRMGYFVALIDTILPEKSQQISDFYQAAMGLNPNAVVGLGGVLNRIHRLKAKLAQTEEEPTSAWEFLGAGRCGFVMADYEHLKVWLKAKTLPDIETKLEAIGLATEADLYKHNILPRVGLITKQTIKANLERYIQKQLEDKRDIRTKVYTALANLKHIHPTLNAISIKVSKVVYRLVTMGLILVPVFLYPITAAVGFGIGFVFFALRRFGVRYTEDIAQFFNNDLHDPYGRYDYNAHMFRTAMNFLAGRNFFTLTPNARNQMETFARADFFGRMRILNLELFITIFIAYAQLSNTGRNELLGAGGFMQGMALAREVTHLV